MSPTAEKEKGFEQVGADPDKVKRGINALKDQVQDLRICKEDPERYLAMGIPKKYPPKEKYLDWVGFGDFKNSEVRNALAKEFEDLEPGKFSLFYEFDLNNFKIFNDKFGETVGDGVIANASYVIANLIAERVGDIEGLKFLRGAGDEFYVVAKDLNEQDAMKVKEAIEYAREKLRYEGRKAGEDMDVPYAITTAAFGEVMEANADAGVYGLVLNNDELQDKIIRVEQANLDVNKVENLGVPQNELITKNLRKSNLDVIVDAAANVKEREKAKAALYDFNNFLKGGKENYPAKLAHFNEYFKALARLPDFATDILYMLTTVEGMMERVSEIWFADAKAHNIASGSFAEAVGIMMMNPYYSKRVVRRFLDLGLVKQEELNQINEMEYFRLRQEVEGAKAILVIGLAG